MAGMKALVLTASNKQIGSGKRQDAFSELVVRFQDAAFEWAYSVLEDANMAQDAVQEAFVVAYQKLDQLRQPYGFPGWLKQIVVSQCYRLTRGKKVVMQPIESTNNLPTPEPGPAAAVEEIELKQKVLAAIQALPDNQQVVTQLFYFKGYSQKEIAKLLELPLTTVKKRLQYARRDLRGILVSMFDVVTPTPAPVPVPIPVQSSQLPPVNHSFEDKF
ncbi:MAG: sigma-70 family RNA polymerase sigma factor [Chloroflexi bacterium]|nr:MAG: sigma-70 family RNA polymerase sigma factor [Chloroflexota bacterium]